MVKPSHLSLYVVRALPVLFKCVINDRLVAKMIISSVVDDSYEYRAFVKLS